MATSSDDRQETAVLQTDTDVPTTPSTQPAAATAPAATESSKPINALVVDTGPIIQNDPTVSSLLAQADELYTIPSVISEIRDETTRTRVEATLLPFLKLRSPKPESIKFVTDFARRTGDLEVLSRPDLHLLALTYELELERNGGDWRLRNTPTQKRVNGKSPAALAALATEDAAAAEPAGDQAEPAVARDQQSESALEDKVGSLSLEEKGSEAVEAVEAQVETVEVEAAEVEVVTEAKAAEKAAEEEVAEEVAEEEEEEEEGEEEEDDDGGDWITPSNLKKHQAKDRAGAGQPEQPIQRRLQAALLTSDFAMQNVALRINLNLLSPALARITQVKTWVLRCHGCFAVTRQMSKQFCPSCGQATLTRTSCSTDQNGQFRVHLKRNYQFNKRGNVYSVPKPVHGSASGKMTDRSGGGGHQGWGRELILSEDQPEYTKKVEEQRRLRMRDMMDEDYLPGLLTGVRNGNRGGRTRVGAGRNVNAKKRK